MKNRFLLFMFNDYYPSGGLFDLVGAYKTLEDAQEAAVNRPRVDDDNAHILDVKTMRSWERETYCKDVGFGVFWREDK